MLHYIVQLLLRSKILSDPVPILHPKLNSMRPSQSSKCLQKTDKLELIVLSDFFT